MNIFNNNKKDLNTLKKKEKKKNLFQKIKHKIKKNQKIIKFNKI